MTTQTILGSWVFQLSVSRHGTGRPTGQRASPTRRSSRFSDAHARSLEATDAELMHINEWYDIDEARRASQSEASLLGVRF